MKPILLVRNDSFETFGIATSALGHAGVSVLVYDAVAGDMERPSLDDVSGVAMFGSSYNVENADEQPFIKELRELTLEALDRGTPFLGVCFGAQILAWSLDAPVVKAPAREIGFVPLRPLPAVADDPLLSHHTEGDHGFEWHEDTFELPPGAELLVSGDVVRNQAYRLGERTWGVQWHLEVDDLELLLWLTVYSERHDLRSTWGKSVEEVRAEARHHMAAHDRKGREIFRRFAEIAREASDA
jgi:GMP synthase (glutamine-hydrolysing)